MNHSHWKIIGSATLGLALGGLLGWQASDWSHRGGRYTSASAEPPAHPSRLDPPRSGNTIVDTSHPGPNDSLKKLIAHLLEGDEEAVLAEFSTEQFDAFLQRHQRNAQSLLAVYSFTRDEALLREAYEKFPDNLLVAEHALASLDLSTDEKLVLLEKVRAAHPNNAWGDLMTAHILLKEGNKDEFLHWLKSGLTKTSFDTGEREQRLARREAMMAVGKSPTEARLLGWVQHSTMLSGVNQVAHSGVNELRQMLKDGREDEAFALAGPMLAMGQRLEQTPGATILTELIALTIQRGLLKSLPGDVEIGETSETADQHFQKADQRGKAISGLVSHLSEDVSWHLQHFDEAGVELYFQVIEERGERAALEWAEAYHGPAPAPQK